MRLSGVNHLAMVTGDMEKTIRFWRDTLGCKLIGTTGHMEGGYPYRHYFFSIGPGSTVAFFEWPDIEFSSKPAGIPARGKVHFDHVSFNVPNLEELLELQAHLRREGVEVTEVVDHKFIKSIYFDDPNGISLEASFWVQRLEEEPFWGDPDPVEIIKREGK